MPNRTIRGVRINEGRLHVDPVAVFWFITWFAFRRSEDVNRPLDGAEGEVRSAGQRPTDRSGYDLEIEAEADADDSGRQNLHRQSGTSHRVALVRIVTVSALVMLKMSSCGLKRIAAHADWPRHSQVDHRHVLETLFTAWRQGHVLRRPGQRVSEGCRHTRA